MHVFLDVSRLLIVAGRPAPSGIDRVELAYARHWASGDAGACTFVAEVPLLGFAALPASLVRELVVALEESWESGTRLAGGVARRARLSLPFGRAALNEALRRPGPKAFLLVSHRALERPGRISTMRRNGCYFIPLIHDLIPLHHPEFARAGQAEKHKRRIITTAALADAIIVNSAATAVELAPWLAARQDRPLIAVAPLGVSPPSVDAPPVALRPYFVALGIIEPRKNHLLLNLWRQFASTMGGAAPRLVVVGRRGWENENDLPPCLGSTCNERVGLLGRRQGCRRSVTRRSRSSGCCGRLRSSCRRAARWGRSAVPLGCRKRPSTAGDPSMAV